MAMPLRQTIRVGTYLFEQKLRKREKFPLIVELEPLFACNLACEGCGKIQHPAGVLKQRMPVAQAVGAVLESGAPMVSIAGGEPLMHPQIHEIVRQLVAKKKYVFLCTNAMLMRKKMDKFTPSPYFAFTVHIDGLRERHDESVAKEGCSTRPWRPSRKPRSADSGSPPTPRSSTPTLRRTSSRYSITSMTISKWTR